MAGKFIGLKSAVGNLLVSAAAVGLKSVSRGEVFFEVDSGWAWKDGGRLLVTNNSVGKGAALCSRRFRRMSVSIPILRCTRGWIGWMGGGVVKSGPGVLGKARCPGFVVGLPDTDINSGLKMGVLDGGGVAVGNGSHGPSMAGIQRGRTTLETRKQARNLWWVAFAVAGHPIPMLAAGPAKIERSGHDSCHRRLPAVSSLSQ